MIPLKLSEENKSYLKTQIWIVVQILILILLAFILFKFLMWGNKPILAFLTFCVVILLGYVIINVRCFKQNKQSLFQFLFAIAAAIVLTLFTFGMAYTLPSIGDNSMLVHNVPKNLTLSEGIYFSTVTITTLGYGDITPQGYFRYFVIAEVIFGVIYFGFFVSGISVIYNRNK